MRTSREIHLYVSLMQPDLGCLEGKALFFSPCLHMCANVRAWVPQWDCKQGIMSAICPYNSMSGSDTD